MFGIMINFLLMVMIKLKNILLIQNQDFIQYMNIQKLLKKRFDIYRKCFWKGGVSGLVALTNNKKYIDIFSCDTFTGVKNATNQD